MLVRWLALLAFAISAQGQDARELNQAGNALFKRAEFAAALEKFRHAVAAAETTSDSRSRAVSHENVGKALQRLGDYPGALEAYEKSLRIATEAGLPAQAAGARLSLSFIFRNQGEYEKALEQIRGADGAFADLKDKLGAARAASAYGTVYTAMGDYRRAAEQTQRALTLAEELKNTQGIALQLNNLALLYSMQGDYELALPYARRALAMKESAGNQADALRSRLLVGRLLAGMRQFVPAREILTAGLAQAEKVGDTSLVSGTLTELAAIAAEQGDLEKALQFARQSVSKLESLGSRAHVPNSLVEQARYELALGRLPDAVASAKRVLTLLGPAGEWISIAHAETLLGKAAVRLGDRATARLHLNNAIEAAEAQRAVTAVADADQQTRDTHLEAYQEMVRLCIAEGKPDEALRIAERSRARRLLAMVQGRPAELTAAERQREAALRERMRGPGWRAARAEHEQFRAELYRRHPEMQTLGAREVEPAAIRSWLRKSRSAAVEYMLTEKEVWALVVTTDRVRALRVGPSGEVAKFAAEFRTAIAGRDPGYRAKSERLYGLLIAPLLGELRGSASLVLAPDGPLWTVPFEALQAPGGRFLLDQFAVSYVPSLAVGAELSARAAPVASGALGVGDLGATEMAGMTRISTAAAFRAEAGKHSVIHIASHGVFDDRGPMYSYLQLADGGIAAWEILRLRLHANVVVLAACETARGHVSEGEGAIGMSWAFLAAGTRAVVASGWKVDTDATSALMTAFHARPGPGALRTAALTVRAQEKWRHPYYWAGFSVLGVGY